MHHKSLHFSHLFFKLSQQFIFKHISTLCSMTFHIYKNTICIGKWLLIESAISWMQVYLAAWVFPTSFGSMPLLFHGHFLTRKISCLFYPMLKIYLNFLWTLWGHTFVLWAVEGGRHGLLKFRAALCCWKSPWKAMPSHLAPTCKQQVLSDLCHTLAVLSIVALQLLHRAQLCCINGFSVAWRHYSL